MIAGTRAPVTFEPSWGRWGDDLMMFTWDAESARENSGGELLVAMFMSSSSNVGSSKSSMPSSNRSPSLLAIDTRGVSGHDIWVSERETGDDDGRPDHWVVGRDCGGVGFWAAPVTDTCEEDGSCRVVDSGDDRMKDSTSD